MSEPKDPGRSVSKARDSFAFEGPHRESPGGFSPMDDSDLAMDGSYSYRMGDGEDLLFDQAELVTPADMDALLERSASHAVASEVVWRSGNSSELWNSSEEGPQGSLSYSEHAAEEIDTAIEGQPRVLRKHGVESEVSHSVIRKSDSGAVFHADQSAQKTPEEYLSRSSNSLPQPVRVSRGGSVSHHLERSSSPYALTQEGPIKVRKGEASLEEEHMFSVSVEDPLDPSLKHDRTAVLNDQTPEVLEAPGWGSHSDGGGVERSHWKVPQVEPSGSWSGEDDPGEVNGVERMLSSPNNSSQVGVETLPIHALGGVEGEEMRQLGGVGDKYRAQFEAIIDTLSGEGVGSREAVREDLMQITAAHYDLIHTTGIELTQSYRVMIAEEQEAVWEQLLAHVELYKDFLYQLFEELEHWRLSDDCCPNLLCRAPRADSQSVCQQCQSEFFYLCASCKSQTSYFSERCRHLQCGQLLSPEDKLLAAAKITNAYAQRQGKASVSAAAAFVLYYLMERFSITTRGDWFRQIDRYRKMQGLVNQEYQRRCMAAFQDEILRILAPAFEHMRQGILQQVNSLYTESRFAASLDTLNSMPAVLQNTEIDEIRHRIYERLADGELNRIESLIQGGKIDLAMQSLGSLSFESPRRRELIEQCHRILHQRQRANKAEKVRRVGNLLFVFLLGAGVVFHWLTMPSFLSKNPVRLMVPYFLLIASGLWLLKRRTIERSRVEWILGQAVATLSIFGGMLFVLLGLQFCSWYLTVPNPLQSLELLPGYRIAPEHANILPAHLSWRILSHVGVVAGLVGVVAGGLAGAVQGLTSPTRGRVLFSLVVGAFGVCFGVALLSAIGITVGSAMSVAVVNTYAAALAVAGVTALMCSVGVEVGLKVASEWKAKRLFWGGVVGGLLGATVGALFGAGVVHNGMTQMQLIHPDVAWAGLPLAAGIAGSFLFVMSMLRARGRYLRACRWIGALSLFVVSFSAWLLL